MRWIVPLCLWTMIATGYARDLGQWVQSDPQVRKWWKDQVNPTTKVSCCSEADGVSAEEDIRNGHYWARWDGSDWTPVPDTAVLDTPNLHGKPVVWWYTEDGTRKIRCYSPGVKS